MLVSDILANLRVRLGDENNELVNFSDSFLIDLIYTHQNKLLSEFESNIFSCETYLNNEDTINLHFEIVKLITAFLNNKPLNLVSYGSAIRKMPTSELFFYEINNKQYAFSHKISGHFKLYGVKKAIITSKEDELVLDDMFSNLLVYSVLLDSFKTKITPDNSQRIHFFSDIVKQEKKEIVALLNRKRSKQAFKSDFIGMI